MASAHTVNMIRFKSIFAQLSDIEMDVFMSRLWRSVGRNRILQFLCTSLPGFATNQTYDYLLQTASGIVSQIIQERDSDEKTKSAEPIAITDLPSCLVGEIASNLAPMDYIAFSKTNRKIFVDSNTPNRLLTMALEQSDDYSGLRLHHFPQIKHFGFGLSRITELHQINGQIFSGNNQIQRMDIELKGAKASDTDILTNDQSPCFRTVHALLLFHHEVDPSEQQLQSIQLLNLLNKFKGLQKLCLDSIKMLGPINETQLRTLCPLLSQLYLLCFYPIGPFLKSWGPNITTLCLEPLYIDDAIEIPECNMPSLRRLHFAGFNYTDSAALLNVSKNASEMSLIPIFCSSEEVESLMNRCIARPKLEFLHTAARSAEFIRQIRQCCNAIKKGLNDTKDIERTRMEIALTVEAASGISDVDHFVQSVMTVIKGFTECKMKEWMFIVEFEYGHADEDQNIKNVKKQLEASLNSTNAFPLTVDLISCTPEELVITAVTIV